LSLRIAKGRRHDFRLWKESKLRLHPQVYLLSDSGYQGIQKLRDYCLKPIKAVIKNHGKEDKRFN
jgi:hypothetical protein